MRELYANRLQSIALAAFLSLSIWMPPCLAEDNVEQMFKNGQIAYARGDVVDAMQWYRKAGQQGHAPAQVRLARILDAAEQNQEAVEWYRKAAEQNFAEAEFELGLMYSRGEGIKKDLAEAVRWLERAAEHGYTAAARVLATAHEKGHLGQQQDEQKALSWWQHGAVLGDPASIRRLVTAYRKGELGLSPDPAKAAELETKLPQVKKVENEKKKK